MNISFLDKIALSHYSSIEKQSMYQMICGALSVDGDRDPRELQMVEEIVSLIGLTPSERQASRSLDGNTMIRILRSMDDMKKLYLAKFISQVVLADGKVDPKEDAFVRYYFDILEIPEI